MEDTELTAIVNAKLTSSLGYMGGMLATERLQAEQYYKGEPFGDEVDGKSKVVSRDVAESIDSMLPPLLKPFTASQEIARFEPIYKPPRMGETPFQAVKRAEVEAKQATHLVNYTFFKRNEGFLVIHDWVKDALWKKLGVLKVFWDTETDVTTESYQGLTDGELHSLTIDPDVAITDQVTYPDPTVPAPQALVAGLTTGQVPLVHDVTCRRTKNDSHVRVINVPPDEFLVDHRAVSMDEAPFLCHRAKHPISELIRMGFDKETVENLPGNDATGDFDAERMERFKDEDEFPYRDDTPGDPSMREVWLNEVYVWIDYDGDGVAELRQVFMAGDSPGTLLSHEPVDDHPFIGFTPIPMPHKLWGMSVADQTMDLQLIKSTLWRGALNSVYLGNEPMIGAVSGEVNMDDLLNRRAGGVVRMQKPGVVFPIPSVNVAPDAFTMMGMIDSVRESRTGVRRFTSTLNADSVDAYSATATGAKLMDDAANDRLELIAKVFAETGVKKLAKRMLELICKHQDRSEVIRMEGQFVEMDPREWSTQMDVTVTVGLGTGDRDRRLSKLMALGPLYQELKAGGSPLVQDSNIYAWLMEICREADLKLPEMFFTDPSQVPPGQQQQRPDPRMASAQAQAGAIQAKAQADIQAQQARTQSDIQIENVRAQHEMQLEQLRAQHDMALERLQAAEQTQRDRDAAARDADLERRKAMHDAGIDRYRVAHDAMIRAYSDGQ